jgi:hypothetical protein
LVQEQLEAEREQVSLLAAIARDPDGDGHREREQIAQLLKLLRRSAESDLAERAR